VNAICRGDLSKDNVFATLLDFIVSYDFSTKSMF